MMTMSYQTAAAVLTGLAVMLMSVAPANAQIYSWRDADGARVVSDRPPSPEAETVTLAGTDDIRVTRAVTRVEAVARYDTLIRHHAIQHGIRADLVRAVIQVESGFDPDARSPVGAMGLMQLMPETARALRVVDPFDPGENVRAGVTYLRQLLNRYDGDATLALAAYNAGPGTVSRYGDTVPPSQRRSPIWEGSGPTVHVGAPNATRPRASRSTRPTKPSTGDVCRCIATCLPYRVSSRSPQDASVVSAGFVK